MSFLEDYVLLEELGQGGFATVYKVKHRQLGYIRAVRVIHQLIAQGENDATYQKFLRECRILLRLGNGNHPNIVHIYQPLLRLQKAVVEMDYIDGEDLSHYLKNCSGFVPVQEVIRLVSDISSALAYCHEDIYRFCMDREEDNLQDDPEDGSKVLIDDATRARLIEKYRVIHNDLHSGNVIRRGNGSYVLLDFGLAIDGDEVVRSSRAVNGAPEFKAPEKWDDESLLTPQSDIYSFGVMLYEYMTGRVPFPIKKGKALSLQALFLLGNAHKTQIPDSIYELRKVSYEAANPGKTYERDYPQWLEDLVMKCLEKKPEDRFKNGKELYDFAIAHMEEDRSGALLEAIENLKAENADLKAENEALKAENAGLKAEMAALKPEEEHMEITDSSDDSHSDSDSQSDTSDDTGGKTGCGWLWWLLSGVVIVVCIGVFGYLNFFSWDEPTGYHEGYGYVDLGLPSDLKWATCNVGASGSSDYGNYFAWGKTSPKSTDVSDNHKVWGDISGNPSLDAAAAKWGGGWRMPTKAEFQELIDNCTWTWTTHGGHHGYKVTGPNGNSIFLPAAGWLDDGRSNIQSDVRGSYWSSNEDSYLSFTYDVIMVRECSPEDGHSIRPVIRFDEAYCEDLSNSGRANCYIVSENGSYKFPTVKGNSSESVGAVKSVEVLWESFGTSTSPEVGDLIKSVSYSDGYITFQTADTFKEGNAVIAARNASGTILWSWHIWLTDQPGKCVYANNAGTMMDRNLGATSATPGDVGALGLLYQWGRKDPFLGSSSISDDVEAKSTITWPDPVSSSSSRGTISYATEHPTTFITYNTNNNDWYYSGSSSTDNTRWQSTKTVYDPCPAGWRVPDAGVWNKARFLDGAYDSHFKGMLYSFGMSSPSSWYPAAGYQYYNTGSLYDVGYRGAYCSVTPVVYGYARGLGFGNDRDVYPTEGYRAYGQSVRCLQE